MRGGEPWGAQGEKNELGNAATNRKQRGFSSAVSGCSRRREPGEIRISGNLGHCRGFAPEGLGCWIADPPRRPPLPDHLDPVTRDVGICRHDCDTSLDGLRHEQAIEGIAMVPR